MRHCWLDRITSLEPGRRAVGIKAVALAEEEFDSHFPGNPVFPGVYILEGMAQTGGVLLYESSGRQTIAVMSSIDRARFTGFARPGDVLEYTLSVESRTETHAQLRGEARVREQMVAAARITFRLVTPERLIPKVFQPHWEQGMEVWLGRYPMLGDE